MLIATSSSSKRSKITAGALIRKHSSLIWLLSDPHRQVCNRRIFRKYCTSRQSECEFLANRPGSDLDLPTGTRVPAVRAKGPDKDGIHPRPRRPEIHRAVHAEAEQPARGLPSRLPTSARDDRHLREL